MFIIDRSASASKTLFKIVKQLLKEFISELDVDIGPISTQSRVGIITYGSSVNVELDLFYSGRMGQFGTLMAISGTLTVCSSLSIYLSMKHFFRRLYLNPNVGS